MTTSKVSTQNDSDLKLVNYFGEIRMQFPIFQIAPGDKPFHYLDNTNTTMKPQVVIDRLTNFYTRENSNVHRGAYGLSMRATENFEATRKHVARYIGAETAEEIVFVRGTTEAINLVASTWGVENIKAGDEILISEIEHHANIVPWQLLAERAGAVIRVARIMDDGALDLVDFKSKLNGQTKLVAMTACSNTLGTLVPISQIAEWTHQAGAKLLVDGAQLVTLKPVDVQALGADFFAFSAHKIFGPTGVGVLYGHKEILEAMPPYQGGGSMISKVTFEKTTYNDIPFRFEAGTPHVAGVIGFDTALNFLDGLDFEAVAQWEQGLLKEATSRLRNMKGIRIYGDLPDKAPILSFNLEGAHSSDVAQIMDQCGVCVRAGHHCTQPLMQRLGVSSVIRASFSIYNTMDDVLALEKSVLKAKELLL